MRVALIGLRGSGKTTVGQHLSHLLSVPFFDSDLEVARLTGRSPAEWIVEEGVAAFREAEREAVCDLAGRPAGVLALGGGAPIDVRNRAALGDWTIVQLDAPDDVLAARIRRDGLDERPPVIADGVADRAPGERRLEVEIAAQRADRCEAYSAMNPRVRHRSVAAQAPEEVARQIVAVLLDPVEEKGKE